MPYPKGMSVHRLLISLLICAVFLFYLMTGFVYGVTDAGVAENKAIQTEGPNIEVLAKSAILIDAGSGKVLFEKNSHDRLPLASVTKVMTMLLILEAVERGQIALTDMVTVSERAAGMGGSQMYLEAGEQQPLELIMEGISICSANDACVAAAEYHSGTIEIFVENMNKRAKELGMKDTHFENTNGLPVANHYSSAYDIAVMSKELMKHEETKKWFTTWQTTIKVGLPGKEQTEFGLTNTNRLIKTYDGANGIKTGFTQDAGYCLSASATRGDLTLISVILGSASTKDRFGGATKLLDYGFANYDAVKMAEKGTPMGITSLDKAIPNSINGVVKEDVTVFIKKGDEKGITGEATFHKNLKAPLLQGDSIGEFIVYQNKKEIDRYPLVADQDVEMAGTIELYIRMLKEGVK